MLSIQDWGFMLGQEIHVDTDITDFKEGVLVAINSSNHCELSVLFKIEERLFTAKFLTEDCKPILRTIDQITRKEIDILIEKFGYSYGYNIDEINLFLDDLCSADYVLYTRIVFWFIQQGIDQLGYIDKGWAIKKED